MKPKYHSPNPSFLRYGALPLLLATSSLIVPAMAQTGTWTGDTTPLTWTTTGNWSGGTVATGSGNTANFTNNITGDRIINITADQTIGNIVFSDSDTATAGSWTIANNGVSTNNLILAGTTPTITVNALGTNKTATISAIIEGTAGLAKAGTGTLTLSGANTFTGGVTLNAGTLNINNNTALGSSSGVLTINNSGSTFDNTSGGLVSISNNITSTHNTVFSGTNALTTSGTYTYSNNNRTLTVNGSGTLTIGSLAVSTGGTNPLRKAGSGTLAITGASTAAGIEFGPSGGVVIAGNKDSLGTGNLAVIGGGSGTLQSSATLTGANKIANGVTLGGALTLSGANNFEIGGVITGAASLTKSGANTVTLSNANTYSGVTIIAGGTLNAATFSNYGVNSSLGNRASDGGGNVGILFQGGTLQYTGSTAQSTNRGIRISTTGGGTIDASGSVPSATLSFTATSSADFFENNGNRSLTLTGSNTGDNTFAMAIGQANGTTSVVKSGAGKWVLTGASTYTGVTTIGNGILSVGTIGNGGVASSNLGSASNSASNIVFDGGTLQYTGSTATSNRAFTINAGKTATIEVATSGQSLSLAGATGTATTGALSKTGSGTLTLTGTNTYTGATTIEAGTLYVTGALSNSAVTVGANGTIGSNGLAGGLGNGLTINAGGNLDLTGALIDASSIGVLGLTGGSLTLGALTFEDLVGWDWLNAAVGTYELIDGSFSINWGSTVYLSEATAYDFGNGKKGYFTSGSLQAVIIPEPSAALLGGLGLLVLLRRRR